MMIEWVFVSFYITTVLIITLTVLVYGKETINAMIENYKRKQSQVKVQSVVFTIPNVLTFARILSIPFIKYYMLTNRHEMACSLFVLAAITDFLDGFIARNFKDQASYLGTIIDPLADKLLIGSITISLYLNEMLPLFVTVIILGRDVALIIVALYIRYSTLQKPVTVRKFFQINKYSTVQVRADFFGKLNTCVQLALISATLPSSIFAYRHSTYLVLLQYLAALTTIMSSLSYSLKRGSYKIVKQP